MQFLRQPCSEPAELFFLYRRGAAKRICASKLRSYSNRRAWARLPGRATRLKHSCYRLQHTRWRDLSPCAWLLKRHRCSSRPRRPESVNFPCTFQHARLKKKKRDLRRARPERETIHLLRTRISKWSYVFMPCPLDHDMNILHRQPMGHLTCSSYCGTR